MESSEPEDGDTSRAISRSRDTLVWENFAAERGTCSKVRKERWPIRATPTGSFDRINERRSCRPISDRSSNAPVQAGRSSSVTKGEGGRGSFFRRTESFRPPCVAPPCLRYLSCPTKGG
ncbi:hypothetical protein KM043_000859 [Ampulex compressa]|nr:hypothetical protein KM043_000859 [Ampulex compressa]